MLSFSEILKIFLVTRKKAALKGQSGQIRTEGEWSIGKANSVLQTPEI
jgi:hypothetical protein